MSERSANVILGAAIIDDILGILVLTVITSMADSSVKIGLVLLKIVGFLIFAAIVGYLIYLLFGKWISMHNVDKRRFVIGAFVICLLMSFSAEQFFGVADITGAFVAGLVLSLIHIFNLRIIKINDVKTLIINNGISILCSFVAILMIWNNYNFYVNITIILLIYPLYLCGYYFIKIHGKYLIYE